MPWIEQLRGGSWRVGWRAEPRAPKQYDGPYPTRADAEAAELRLRAQIAAPPGPTPLPWGEVVERWIVTLGEATPRRRARSPRYLAEVRAALLKRPSRPRWTTTADATGDALERLPAGTLRITRACLRWARAKLRQPVDEVALAVDPPQPARRPAADDLGDEQVAALVARARRISPAGAAIAHLVATYGHRPESLTAVRVGDFDLRAGLATLRVKSGDTIRHPLLPATVAALRPLLAERGEDEPAFRWQPRGATEMRPWKDGREYASWWRHQVGEHERSVTREQAGIYALKRHAISKMLGRGLDLATIASITGHRTPTVLLRYARTTTERQRAALDALGSLPHAAPRRKQKTR